VAVAAGGAAGDLSPVWVPEVRMALVIGNSGYGRRGAAGRWPDLGGGPLKDADAMAARLKGIGFTVVEAKDQNLEQMSASLREFAAQIRAAPDSLALFYYAGLCARVSRDSGGEGEDIGLIPVDAATVADADGRDQRLPLTQVRQALSRSRAGVVIMDACRHPSSRGAGSRGRVQGWQGGGLLFTDSAAAAEATATRPGQVSEYTQALVRQLGVPGQTLTCALRRVRAQMARLRGGSGALPELADALTQDIVLVPR
jgi:uncharacterized caspase-like protein